MNCFKFHCKFVVVSFNCADFRSRRPPEERSLHELQATGRRKNAAKAGVALENPETLFIYILERPALSMESMKDLFEDVYSRVFNFV